MVLNDDQNSLLDAAAKAVSCAWDEQWTMIEEVESTLAAEYLMTTAVARALAQLKPGCVRIERLIGRAFRNSIMRGLCTTPVPAELRQGRIDVVVAADAHHIKPYCLVELKRKRDTSIIFKDADRIARLISHTGPTLTDIFGFCLFPIILHPRPTDPPDYETPRDTEIDQVRKMVQRLQGAHQDLTIDVQTFSAVCIEKASIVAEIYDDGTEETVWDPDGFRMEPVAIVVHKRDATRDDDC